MQDFSSTRAGLVYAYIQSEHNGHTCTSLRFYVHTSKLKILQIIMWNIGMAQKAKETRSGCLVHIVQ